MVEDGGLVKLVSGPGALRHGVVVVGGEAEVGLVVRATVDDDAEEEVEDPVDVVVLLAFRLPPSHAAVATLRKESMVRATEPLTRPRMCTCSRRCRPKGAHRRAGERERSAHYDRRTVSGRFRWPRSSIPTS
jgi:hypothetical protein